MSGSEAHDGLQIVSLLVCIASLYIENNFSKLARLGVSMPSLF